MVNRGKATPILDVKTRRRYRSKAAAGRELAHLVKGDPKDTFVWYKLRRAMPQRFRVMNTQGEWVRLDDPSAPVGTLRDDEHATSAPSERTRLTTLHVNERKLDAVKAILGTQTLRDTVDRAFDEVIAHAARAQSIAQLQSMEGLDLDKPAVMQKAWR